jgi:DNA-binding response OmpR family regulator
VVEGYARSVSAEHSESAIVVVGHSPNDIVRLTDALRASGFTAEGVCGYHAGRRRVLTSPPRLLITDVRLGDHNGLQLVFCAKNASSAGAIVMDAHFDPVIESEAVRFGAAYVVKSADISEIIAHVSQILTTPLIRDQT